MGKEINRWKESGSQICQTAFKGFFLSFFLDNRRNYWKVILSGSTAGGGREWKSWTSLSFYEKINWKKKSSQMYCFKKRHFLFLVCKKDLSRREQVESYSESAFYWGTELDIPGTTSTVTWTGCWRAANTMGWRVLQQFLSCSSVTWCQLLISSFSRFNFSFLQFMLARSNAVYTAHLRTPLCYLCILSHNLKK